MNFCYSHRQNYSYLFQLIGAVALALWAQPTAAYAQRISATARVQETNINVGAFTGGFNRGSGTSIAGAQVFNPRATSMTVSDSAAMTDRAANASEAPLIQRALDALSAIPGAPDKLSSKPYVDAFKSATNAIVPKPNAVPPAFPEVKKAKNDVLQAQASIGNPAVQESGLATAMQTVSADGETEKFTENPQTTLDKKGAVSPAATAFAYNRDPLLVAWPGAPSVTLSLADAETDPSSPTTFEMTAQATPGARAAAVADFSVSFVNYDTVGDAPDDLLSVENIASSLFELSGTLVNNGVANGWNFDFTLGAGVRVSDRFGDTNAHSVLTHLNCGSGSPGCLVTFDDGTLSINQDFSLTFTLPDDPGASALFINDGSGAAAGAVPELHTVTLLALGLFVLWGLQKAPQTRALQSPRTVEACQSDLFF